jgi:phosphatidylglycerol:prolipoprotein diacylglycerol transferase
VQPELFDLFGTAVPSYFALLVTGFLLATALGALWARRIGQDPDTIVDLGLGMLLWGVVGARLLHVLADGFFWDYVHLCTEPAKVLWKISEGECRAVIQPDALAALFGEEARALGAWDPAAGGCRPIERDCLAWARFWAGGLTFYGGLLLALPMGYRLLVRRGFPVRRALDMGGLVIPVGLAFGRMGCLLGGCCFGKPLEGPWGLSFPPGSPASVAQATAGLLSHAHQRSLSVHPTQLYEAFGSLLLAGLLYFGLHGRKRYDGQVFLGFLGGYAALRFAIEFARADDRGALSGLSTSQWIGLGLLGLTLVLHHRWRQASSAPAFV